MAFPNLRAPYATLQICVDRAGPTWISGSIYSQRLTKPIDFSDFGAVLPFINEILDRQNSPQAFQKLRSFAETASNVPAAESPKRGLPREVVEAQRGALDTFRLRIFSRRNCSWQGEVDWGETMEPQKFSSALELTKVVEKRLQLRREAIPMVLEGSRGLKLQPRVARKERSAGMEASKVRHL